MNSTMVLPKEAKVLVVGAGGIGCELLKNLAIDGFRDITIIDLDTIDISNLNRQFLFQKCHVGRSKAEVAKESVLKFRSDVRVVAFHESIFSPNFGTDFFSSFDLVFNALDNQAARRHVNRLCVSTERPLIESGTAGYLGQVEPFVPGGFSLDDAINGSATSISTNGTGDSFKNSNECKFRTGCYECQPRATGQRSFAACTIRNTPSEPIHCVVWAKYLFNNLFGEPDLDDEDVSPDTNDPELQKNAPNAIDDSALLRQNTETGPPTETTDERKTLSLREWFQQKWSSSSQTESTVDTVPDYVESLAWRLFHDDIVTLISMRDLWVNRKDRREPTPLSKESLSESIRAGAALPSVSPQKAQLTDSNKTELRDQRKLCPGGWLRLFMDSVCALQGRIASGSTQNLTWDKDDDDAMDFVAGAAILRAHLFHLPGAEEMTRFTAKSLAGNIVPAIATTNAIVAGLMVLQAHHVLAKNAKNIRTIYLHRNPTGRRGNRRLVVPCEPPTLNPSCYVCSHNVVKSRLCLYCDPSSLTLRVLRDHILIRHLGMLAPDVELADLCSIIISSEEGETDEATLNKPLADFEVRNGYVLNCEDFLQDFNICLIVSVRSRSELQAAAAAVNEIAVKHCIAEDLTEGWRLVGNLEALTEAKAKLALSNPKDDLSSPSLKRTHEAVADDADNPTVIDADSDGPQPIKRVRLDTEPTMPGPVDVVVDDEDEDDLIMMD